MAAPRNIQAEQGVIDAFRDYYRKFSEFKGSTGQSFSVGARDKLIAGDYIFVSDSYFTLIEFKWDEDGFKKERAKSIAKLLCPALNTPGNEPMRKLAKKCHRIAWNNGLKVELGTYLDVVCCGGSQGIQAKDFCSQWFTPPPPHRASYDDFQKYIKWILSLSSSSQSELLLIGGNHIQEEGELPDLFLGQFYGIEELKEWLDENEPPQPTSSYGTQFTP